MTSHSGAALGTCRDVGKTSESHRGAGLEMKPCRCVEWPPHNCLAHTRSFQETQSTAAWLSMEMLPHGAGLTNLKAWQRSEPAHAHRVDHKTVRATFDKCGVHAATVLVRGLRYPPLRSAPTLVPELGSDLPKTAWSEPATANPVPADTGGCAIRCRSRNGAAAVAPRQRWWMISRRRTNSWRHLDIGVAECRARAR